MLSCAFCGRVPLPDTRVFSLMALQALVVCPSSEWDRTRSGPHLWARGSEMCAPVALPVAFRPAQEHEPVGTPAPVSDGTGLPHLLATCLGQSPMPWPLPVREGSSAGSDFKVREVEHLCVCRKPSGLPFPGTV